jgi:hypothetical protein
MVTVFLMVNLGFGFMEKTVTNGFSFSGLLFVTTQFMDGFQWRKTKENPFIGRLTDKGSLENRLLNHH